MNERLSKVKPSTQKNVISASFFFPFAIVSWERFSIVLSVDMVLIRLNDKKKIWNMIDKKKKLLAQRINYKGMKQKPIDTIHRIN